MYLENVVRAGRTHRRSAVDYQWLLTSQVYRINLIRLTLYHDAPAIFHSAEIKDAYTATFLTWRQAQ